VGCQQRRRHRHPIDPRTDKVVATIDVGGSPQGITIASGRASVTVGAAAVTPHLAASGGTLRVEALGGVDPLDSALAYSPGSWQLLYATCAKLLNYPDRSGSAGGQLTPEIARSLPVRSADGRTYTFTIRTGFRFSPPSNQPVTAQTLKGTIERTLNPRTRSPIGYEFTDVVGASAYMAGKTAHIAGVAARGDTLTIRLLAPDADIPSLLAQPFFCAVPSDTPVSPDGVRVIPSAGPYYVASDTPGQAVVLARNPNYRGGRPHRLDRIDVTLGISSKRAVADIEAGSADDTIIGGDPSANALASGLAAHYGPGSAAAARGAQQYFATQTPGLDFFVLNTHRPLFSDVRLRRAVNYAIDRRALARFGDGYVGADHPTSQYLPPGIPGSSNSPTYPLTPDASKARELARGRDRTAVLYACDYSACLQLAQIATNDLRAIGLRVHVELFDHATLYAQMARPNAPFDLAFGTWLPDYPDPGAMLSGMLENSSFYPTFADPTYRRRLASAEQLSGPPRYLAFGKLAQDLARKAAPLVAYGNSATRNSSPRGSAVRHMASTPESTSPPSASGTSTIPTPQQQAQAAEERTSPQAQATTRSDGPARDPFVTSPDWHVISTSWKRASTRTATERGTPSMPTQDDPRWRRSTIGPTR
jgi:peptide/nickel transport system substrate-binding protein